MIKPPTNEEICIKFEQLVEIENAEERRQKREEVIAELLRASSFLPKKIVRKYKGLDDYDDLYQVGCIVLLMAIRSFDYTQSRNFYAWCYRWIKKEVARSALKYKLYAERNELVDFQDLRIDKLAEIDLEATFFEHECSFLVSRAVNNLSKRRRYIINKVFGIEGAKHSLREISKEMKMSHEQVRRIKEETLRQLSDSRVLSVLWSGEE